MKQRVYCENCDHVVEKKGPTRIWLCILLPRDGAGYVTEKLWDQDFPYERCVDANRFGNCGWFKPAREVEE